MHRQDPSVQHALAVESVRQALKEFHRAQLSLDDSLMRISFDNLLTKTKNAAWGIYQDLIKLRGIDPVYQDIMARYIHNSFDVIIKTGQNLGTLVTLVIHCKETYEHLKTGENPLAEEKNPSSKTLTESTRAEAANGPLEGAYEKPAHSRKKKNNSLLPSPTPIESVIFEASDEEEEKNLIFGNRNRSSYSPGFSYASTTANPPSASSLATPGLGKEPGQKRQ